MLLKLYDFLKKSIFIRVYKYKSLDSQNVREVVLLNFSFN